MDQPRLRNAVCHITLGILVQVLAISCWFATAAAVPSLTVEFGLDEAARVLLVAAVQAGFAVGAVAVGLGAVADRVAPGLLIPLGATATAAATVLPLAASDSFELLVASRFLVGGLLAVVYPVGMRATVSWAPPRWRGLAVAGVVGALTLGTAAPYLLDASPVADWRHVMLICAAAALAAALLGLLLRPGPYIARTTRARITGNPLRPRRQRLITTAYVGHMWEVYGLWVWLPGLLAVIPALASTSAGAISFAVIGVVGALGCLLGGALAARYGKRVVARWCVGVSAVCALATPLLPEIPVTAVLVVLAVWSAAAIADSPLYSALTGDHADPRQVGSAIALQMGIGYLVSIAAIALVAAMAALVGWRYAFLVLAIGPVVSFVALAPRRHPL